jgi:hypothetical protein
MIVDVIFIHDTDYMRVIIIRVRSGQYEYIESIHLSDFKTVILRISSRTVWFEEQHVNELPMRLDRQHELYICFQILFY